MRLFGRGKGVSEARVRAALAGVALPDGRPIGEAHVRSLVVGDGRAAFALALDLPRESAETVRAEAEAAVSTIDGIDKVLAAVVEDRPGARAPAARPAPGDAGGSQASGPQASGQGRAGAARVGGPGGARPGGPQPGGAPPGAAQGGAATPMRPQAAAIAERMRTVARIIAVGSGKGGVGKSTVSVNLAVALANLGWRVGLLDADIYGPSVPHLVGASGVKPRQVDGALQPVVRHGIAVMSIGFLVDPAKAVVWRGPMVTGALGQLMRDTAWGTLDCLLIDMPPGTGDIQLSLSQQAALTGAVVVTTPQDLALIDVRKAADMFATVNVPILGIVENMAGFACPRCGEVTDIFGAGGGSAEAQARGVPLLGRVPLTMPLREGADAGAPAATGTGPEADVFAAIAAELVAQDQPVRPFPAITFA